MSRPAGSGMFPERDNELRRYALATDKHGKFEYTIMQISAHMDIATSTIIRRLVTLGIKRRSAKIDWDSYHDKLVALAAERDTDGLAKHSISGMARILGVPHDAVWRYCRKHQIGYNADGTLQCPAKFGRRPAPRPEVEKKSESHPKTALSEIYIRGPQTLPPLPSLQQPLPDCCRRMW